MAGSRGARSRAWKSAQQSPSMQSVEKTPGRPRSPRRARERTVRMTGPDTARPSSTGDPRVTRPVTSSGCPAASARASVPPRLCPITITGPSNSASFRSRRESSRPAQPTVDSTPPPRTSPPPRPAQRGAPPGGGGAPRAAPPAVTPLPAPRPLAPGAPPPPGGGGGAAPPPNDPGEKKKGGGVGPRRPRLEPPIGQQPRQL